MSVWGKISGKRKKFLSLLCDRVSPYEACREVWPEVKDVHGHVTRITSDEEFKAVHDRLMEYQSSQAQLIMDCRRVIESYTTPNDERLSAIRTIAAMKGYIKTGVAKSGTTRRQTVPIDDDTLVKKMAELGQKAYKSEKVTHGHSQKPS